MARRLTARTITVASAPAHLRQSGLPTTDSPVDYRILGCGERPALPHPRHYRIADSPTRHFTLSPNELSGNAAGHPTMTRNTSSTNNAMAISLNNVARGELGQN